MHDWQRESGPGLKTHDDESRTRAKVAHSLSRTIQDNMVRVRGLSIAGDGDTALLKKGAAGTPGSRPAALVPRPENSPNVIAGTSLLILLKNQDAYLGFALSPAPLIFIYPACCT
jgi:hypothetical protein